MGPLKDLELDQHVVYPDDPRWASMASSDRDTVMRLLLDLFPSQHKPHLQRGLFAVLQEAAKVAQTSADPQAMEEWCNTLCNKMQGSAESTEEPN